MWPWSTIHKLRAELAEAQKRDDVGAFARVTGEAIADMEVRLRRRHKALDKALLQGMADAFKRETSGLRTSLDHTIGHVRLGVFERLNATDAKIDRLVEAVDRLEKVMNGRVNEVPTDAEALNPSPTKRGA